MFRPDPLEAWGSPDPSLAEAQRAAARHDERAGWARREEARRGTEKRGSGSCRAVADGGRGAPRERAARHGVLCPLTSPDRTGRRPRKPASASRTEPAQPQERLGPPRRFRGPGDWQSPAGRAGTARGSGKVPSDRPPEYGEQVEPTRPSSVKATSVKVRLFTSQRDGPCASGGLSSATYRYQQPLTSTTRATSRSIFHSAGVRRERDRAPRFWTLGWRV